MQEAYEFAQKTTAKSAEWGGKNSDKNNQCSILKEGDHVLVRNLTPRGGTGKLRNYWEKYIYKVVCHINNDLPVYEVVPEQGKGRNSRILHCSILLPCNYRSLEASLKVIHPKRRSKGKMEEKKPATAQSESDSDDWYCYSPGQTQQTMQPQTSKPTVPAIGVLNDSAGVELKESQVELAWELHIDEIHIEPSSLDRREILPEEEKEAEEQITLLNHGRGDGEYNPPQPKRMRRTPKFLTYHKLGNPTCNEVSGVTKNRWILDIVPPTVFVVLTAFMPLHNSDCWWNSVDLFIYPEKTVSE